jgi:hypothetical protein
VSEAHSLTDRATPPLQGVGVFLTGMARSSDMTAAAERGFVGLCLTEYQVNGVPVCSMLSWPFSFLFFFSDVSIEWFVHVFNATNSELTSLVMGNK